MTTEITVHPLSEREAFFAAQLRRQNNEADYEVTVNVLALPTELTVHEVDEDAVRVTSADIGVLAAWLGVKGGTVSRTDTGHGVTVWTLATNAGADEGYVGCRVLVTVPVAESAYVPFEVTSAVAA
ncbi:hypothetical protein KVH27_19295 [Streptomyces olivaceus]|uniref:hypothetical protein n=1 Tax=Streptomyces olivaceus TaxID=47716 RepID=UPI001CCD6F03|nr:hypothetical protein [Streptomyces olivaceus]MBZ6250513.1 hypothetical protein [Streptomyces olivaceus]